MKTLCLILLLGLSMPGCSMWKKEGRQSRTYTKYLKKMKANRERERTRVIKQRAEMPVLRNQQPSPPEVSVQTSESQ